MGGVVKAGNVRKNYYLDKAPVSVFQKKTAGELIE